MDNDEPFDPKELLALLEISCKTSYESVYDKKYTGWVSYDEYFFYLTKGIHDRAGKPASINKDNGKLTWIKNGNYHRLDGPATEEGWFYVEGVKYSEQEYWNHPMVVKYKLEKILEV